MKEQTKFFSSNNQFTNNTLEFCLSIEKWTTFRNSKERKNHARFNYIFLSLSDICYHGGERLFCVSNKPTINHSILILFSCHPFFIFTRSGVAFSLTHWFYCYYIIIFFGCMFVTLLLLYDNIDVVWCVTHFTSASRRQFNAIYSQW